MGNSIVKVKKKKKSPGVKVKDTAPVPQAGKRLMAYTVFLPVCIKPNLDIFELTTLRYLRQGETKQSIQYKLNIPIEDVLARLRDKKILNASGAFSYPNVQAWYTLMRQKFVKAVVFFDTEEGMFFNTWFYPEELEGPSLTTHLGCSYISLSDIEAAGKALHIIDSCEVDYTPSCTSNNLRRITDSAFEYLDYVFMGLPKPVYKER